MNPLQKYKMKSKINESQKRATTNGNPNLCLSAFDGADSNVDRTLSILRKTLPVSSPPTQFLWSLLKSALIRVSNNTMMAVKGCLFSYELPLSVTTQRGLSTPLDAINRFYVTIVEGGNNRETLNLVCTSDVIKLIGSVIRAFDICTPDKQLTLTRLNKYLSSPIGHTRGLMITIA